MSIDTDFLGKHVRLNPLALDETYREEQFLTVIATGGSGTMPQAIGSAVFVRWCDGDEGQMRRHQVVRLATDEEAAAFDAALAKHRES